MCNDHEQQIRFAQYRAAMQAAENSRLPESGGKARAG
jgi:hypothetical protein